MIPKLPKPNFHQSLLYFCDDNCLESGSIFHHKHKSIQPLDKNTEGKQGGIYANFMAFFRYFGESWVSEMIIIPYSSLPLHSGLNSVSHQPYFHY